MNHCEKCKIDFDAIDSMEYQVEIAKAEIERLKAKLEAVSEAVDNTYWGYDGDCGLGAKIDLIIGEVAE